MGLGRLTKSISDPISLSIAEVEAETTSEIRVQISQRWLDRDPYQRALELFAEYELYRTRDRNAVLFYINLRKKTFAIVGDTGIHEKVGKIYWDQLRRELTDNLRSTQSERAIALTIQFLGKSLKKHFPKEE